MEELPDQLAEMALFIVTTGRRNKEVCNFRWNQQCLVPELDTSVFIIPGELVKYLGDLPRPYCAGNRL